MTEIQENPYFQRPQAKVLQGRSTERAPFGDIMVVPRDSLEKITDEVDRFNAIAGFKRYRIVTR